jgi:CMP-N-acetylneuraminic acid synthetase
MSVLAVIPARGGSKGVPRKNLASVGGRTLLARAIAACRDAVGVDLVHVSTDDPEIQAAARAAGAEVPALRPADLASDWAPTLLVVRHAVELAEAAGEAITVVVLVEPTSPFRTADHVAAALARFREGDCRCVASVCAIERKPENIFIRDRHLRSYIEAPRERFSRRQDMAHLCRINSAVYVVNRDDVLAGELLPHPIGWIDMDAFASVNIDSPLDLAFADFLASREGL